MKSGVQPESHQTFQTGHLDSTNEKGSFQRVHINNHTEFWHETNFHGRPTQEFITEVWNYKKIFTEEKVMNFTNMRFSRPSSCEYQLLGVDLNPTMKRSESNSIMDFKRDVFWIQQAKNQEERPSKKLKI